MSLTWDITRCAETPEQLNDGPDGSALTEAIVFGTMHVGMGEITEANAREFWARCRLVEQLYGTWLSRVPKGGGKPEPRPITPADVTRYIGLRTNVPLETRASFVKRQVSGPRGFLDDSVRSFTSAAFNVD